MCDNDPNDQISTESTEYDPSYYTAGDGSDSHLEQREAFEEKREYDIWRDENVGNDADTVYLECGEGLATFGTGLDMLRNLNRDPIVYVTYGDVRKTMPKYVVALIEAHHVDRGESTNGSPQARAIAKVIRSRGVKHGKRYIDQCGHIVARKLGGLMRHGNLIPQGKTTNLNQYLHAESIIVKHLQNQRLHNPRAVVQVGLVYGNDRYPMRPTKFLFSYVLFHGPDNQNNTNNQPVKLAVNIRFATSNGVVRTIAIRDDQVVAARTQIRYNNVRQFFNQLAFWSAILAAVSGLAMNVPAVENVVSPPFPVSEPPIIVPNAPQPIPPAPIPIPTAPQPIPTAPQTIPPAPILIPPVPILTANAQLRFLDAVLTCS